MKDEEILEYHPNGETKHKIWYYANGTIRSEQFYDENHQYHRENSLPDYQVWNEKGMLYRKVYTIHGETHNINVPADIHLGHNGKILWKSYWLNGIHHTKLEWKNKIKNIC